MLWLNSYKDVYSTNFLVYEHFIDELSVILVLHLSDNTIIFIFLYPHLLFQTFTMTSIPSFYSILSDILKNIYPVNFCEFTLEPSSIYYPLFWDNFCTFMLILHYSHVFTLHNYRLNQKCLKQVHDKIFDTIYRY